MLTQTLSRSHSVVAFLDILPGSYANLTTLGVIGITVHVQQKYIKTKRQVNREKYCD